MHGQERSPRSEGCKGEGATGLEAVPGTELHGAGSIWGTMGAASVDSPFTMSAQERFCTVMVVVIIARNLLIKALARSCGQEVPNMKLVS